MFYIYFQWSYCSFAYENFLIEMALSGQRIVALQARKIAQQAIAQLEIDMAYLKEYQAACQNEAISAEQFDTITKQVFLPLNILQI